MSISNILSARYARALFTIALYEKELGAIQQDFLKIEQAIADNSSTLLNITFPTKFLNKLWLQIGNILELHELTKSFVKLLIKNKRLNVFKQILDSYQRIILEHNNIKTVHIISAIQIDIKDIVEKLEEHFGSKVMVKHKIDPSLLGGFKLMIDSRMLDCSIKSKLNAIQRQLQNIRIK